jgi:hypothetical protein
MTKITESGAEAGSISQRHVSADPYQYVKDQQHWLPHVPVPSTVLVHFYFILYLRAPYFLRTGFS